MLAKCANPLCSATFRRPPDGKLFRLGTDSAIGSSRARLVEYFWLCHRCSSVMTLRLKEDGAVGAVLLLEAIRAPATLTLAHRQRGLMLRAVNPDLPAHSTALSRDFASSRMTSRSR